MKDPGVPALPQFPGAVGLTDLQAYPWPTHDGRRGGSPHMHLACSECYIVVEGAGSLQTMTMEGVNEVALTPGDVVWFTPGTIHRTINDGNLRVLVVMQNGGLPEAGDAVMTFPQEYLTDADTYARAASILGADGKPDAALAQARRDLAVEGFTRIRDRWENGDRTGLEDFYAAATRLIKDKLPQWQARLAEGAAMEAEKSASVLQALSAGCYDHLRKSAVARIEKPGSAVLGMCGTLLAYDPIRLIGTTSTVGNLPTPAR